MFGYVRPLRSELKCKDFDLYQATYCGLCRNLRRRYGMIAPMFLNYDFTFLALLLWQPEEHFQSCRGRCHANPLRKKAMCQDDPALDMAADESVILAYWKLKDAIEDDGMLAAMPARLLALLLGRAYQKAARLRPEFNLAVKDSLHELSALEKAGCASMDQTADTFARLLQRAAPAQGEQGRVLAQLLYHLGRWIYLIDAQDDLVQDLATGSYNAVASRYGAQGDISALQLTLDHSLSLMGSALALGGFGCREQLLEHIIYLGLPLVQRAVLSGEWAQIKKQKIWSNRT